MATHEDYRMIPFTAEDKEQDLSNLAPSPEIQASDDDSVSQEEEPIVYRETGAGALDLPEALLEAVRSDVPVECNKMSSHGDDEEERGDHTHVATALPLHVCLDEFDAELNESLVRVSLEIIKLIREIVYIYSNYST